MDAEPDGRGVGVGPHAAQHIATLGIFTSPRASLLEDERSRARLPPEKLREVIDQSRARSAVFDVLSNGVPIEIQVDAC